MPESLGCIAVPHGGLLASLDQLGLATGVDPAAARAAAQAARRAAIQAKGHFNAGAA